MPYMKDPFNPSPMELERRKQSRKLTRQQVLDARQAYLQNKVPIKLLATQYKVSPNTIWRYVRMPYSQIPIE